MPSFSALFDSTTRLVAGLMSGTSLDGIDAAIARISGSGTAMSTELLAFAHQPYAAELQNVLLQNADEASSSVRDLTLLGTRLADLYAEAVRAALDQMALGPSDLDLMGIHGQTVCHVPKPADCAGAEVRGTLQVGNPSVLANRLGVPVVGDFRAADMALGGQGAPLVPYFDYVYFTDAHETRGLLNLGGIANLTVLPAGGGPSDVTAFDTGPANMVIDALARRLFQRGYDADGALAAEGTRDPGWLADLLDDPYFAVPPPKSTGRARFGTGYAEQLVEEGRARGCSAHDLMATATALTAYSVYQAYAQFIRDTAPLDVLIASGGGIYNRTLMGRLSDAFAPIPVRTAADYGLDPDAKEALCFAVLAHETVNGVPTNLPSVTGAARPTLLGSLSLPGWRGGRGEG